MHAAKLTTRLEELRGRLAALPGMIAEAEESYALALVNDAGDTERAALAALESERTALGRAIELVERDLVAAKVAEIEAQRAVEIDATTKALQGLEAARRKADSAVADYNAAVAALPVDVPALRYTAPVGIPAAVDALTAAIHGKFNGKVRAAKAPAVARVFTGIGGEVIAR